MSLRVKLTVGVILVILGTVLLSTFGVSYLVGKQNDEYSRNLVLKAQELVKNSLSFLQETSLSHVTRFTSDPANNVNMKYLNSIKGEPNASSYRFILDRPKEEMVSTLYGMIRSGNFDGFHIYDRFGDIIICLERKNGQVNACISSFDDAGNSVFKCNTFNNNQETGWVKGLLPKHSWSKPGIRYPFQNEAWFQMINENLALTGTVSFRSPDEISSKDNSLGNIIFYKSLDRTFSERLRIEIQVEDNMEVNIFSGQELTQGTLKSFNHLPKDFKEMVDQVVVNTYDNQEYYQAFITLPVPEGNSGTIVLSLSRSKTVQKTRENIIMLLGIMGFCLGAAIPATIYMAERLSSKINDILITVNNITGGNRSARVRVTSQDELGKLAEAFNQMTEDLQKSINLHQESAEKYQNLFNSAPDGIVITTPPGDILSFNETFMKMFKFDVPEEVLQSKITEFYDRESERSKFLEHIEHNGKIDKFEVKFKTRYGETFIASLSSRKIVFDNKMAYQSIFRDITAYRQAEEEIRRLNRELEQRVIERTAQLEKTIEQARDFAKRAEAASISKSQFLANMSHEIRTPMNGIIGACDLLISSDMQRKQKEYVNIIRTSARALLGLINDILDFSKIEAGKLDFVNTSFSLRSLIEEVCDMFYENISKKNSELIIDIDPTIPKQIIADPLRLRQVLVNLTSNAFKFTDNGEICISVLCRNKSTESVELLFCVRDTGIGIAPEIQERLFDAFMQGDGSMTRKYGGTGLGLAISKRIITMMNGRIWVESKPGCGSSFYFVLKFNFLPDVTAREDSIPPELHQLKVLLVEDNAAAQKIIKRYLESFGCRAQLAQTAEDAMVMYEKEANSGDPFGLILMDYKLPGMDGVTASELIKKNDRFKAPPIIIISGYIRDNGIRRAKEAGIESYMIKPVKRSLLFDTIMEIFGCKAIIIDKTIDKIVSPYEFSDVCALLVEDNPTNRRIGSELLEMAGIKVDTAVSGIDAIDAVKKKSYDVVFMDIQMPEMDGFEATKIIRNELKMNDLPIIAMTAHAMTGDRKKCLDAGMNDYIPKPIDRKELFAVLRKSLKGKVRVSNEIHGINHDVSDAKHTDHEASLMIQDSPLPPLPGLNVKECLERLGIDINVYADIVKIFSQDQKDFIRNFLALIQKKDFNEARRAAHGLKGAAGNISAIDLRNSLQLLEDACMHSHEEDILKITQSVENNLVQVISSIELLGSLIEKNKPSAFVNTAVSQPIPFDLFKKLEKSLAEFDPVQSLHWIREIISSGVSWNDIEYDISELETSIENYSFEKAGEILSRVLRNL